MSAGDCYNPRAAITQAARDAARAQLQQAREAALAKKQRATANAQAATRDVAATPSAPAEVDGGDFNAQQPYGPSWQDICPPGWPPEVKTYTRAASQALIEEMNAEITELLQPLAGQIAALFDAINVVLGSEGGLFFLPQQRFDVRPLTSGVSTLLTNPDTANVPRGRGAYLVDSHTRSPDKAYRSAIGPLQILPRTLAGVLRLHHPEWSGDSPTHTAPPTGVWAWDPRLEPGDQYKWLVYDHLIRVQNSVLGGTPLYYIGIAIHLNNMQGDTGDRLLQGLTGGSAEIKQQLTDRLNNPDAETPGAWNYIPGRTREEYAQYKQHFRIVATKWNAKANTPGSPFAIDPMFQMRRT